MCSDAGPFAAPVTILVERDVAVPMRDGCVLRANVYRPTEPGRYPALVARTPYNKDLFQTTYTNLDPVRAAGAGYVVVIQDTRGRFASAGERFEPYRDDLRDGYDTIEWAASLPYSNGETGAYGVSYLGGTAWLAAAEAPPSLRAIAPTQAPNDLFVNLAWRGGAFMWGHHLFWSLATVGLSELVRQRGARADLADQMLALADDVDSFDELVRTLPPDQLRASDRDDPFFPFVYDMMSHATWGDYYDQRGTLRRHGRVSVPALIVAGWYDVLLGSDLDHYSSLRDEGATPLAREASRLVIGPWSHGVGLHNPAVGQVDFGVRASGMNIDMKEDLSSLHLRWFNRWLKHGDDDDQPPVKLFVMGANRWRDEDAWPLARAQPQAWHLRTDGRLSLARPSSDESPCGYAYDPAKPCPTLGGNLLMPLNYQRGPVDQTSLLERSDVLVFTSEPLQEELEVTGRVTAVLYAATSGPDTDWVVKLCDVTPAGGTLNVCDGILCASFRDGDWSSPVAVPPGEVLRYEVDLWATSMLFKAGHRIRVLVSSSDFPRYVRNPNTGVRGVSARTFAVAQQHIYCDAARPSHVLLPIVS